MLPKKLLTISCKIIALLLLLVLSSCSYGRINNKVFNNIYVKPIENIDGIIIRNELLMYFPNQDYNSSEYILDITLKNNRSLYLTDSRGFATRIRVSINVKIAIIRKKDNKIIAQISNNYADSYSVLSSGVASDSLDIQTNENLLVYIAKDIFLNVHGLVKKFQLDNDVQQIDKVEAVNNNSVVSSSNNKQ